MFIRLNEIAIKKPFVIIDIELDIELDIEFELVLNGISAKQTELFSSFCEIDTICVFKNHFFV